ncbi:MAG: outer membrane protein transport protein [Rhodocyclaceae bacterium]|nr:outer membrane protein transport protein [Rhodocyclaceae bacterium]
MNFRTSLGCGVIAAALAPAAWATNGMNMAGYGPVAAAMGGVSMAYDNGAAAVINNPTTLGLMAPGSSQVNVALGALLPQASSLGQDSSARAFFMPAFGYVTKGERLAWGLGVSAQGGMGTDYSSAAVFGSLAGMNFPGSASPGPYALAQKNLENKSEVGVGRVILPLAYNASDDLTVGGSLDFLWAGMDIRWLMDGAHFADMMTPGGGHFGRVTGSMMDGFQTAAGLTPNPTGCGTACFTALDYGYLDFASGSKFNQKAMGTGWAANLGFTYRVSPTLTVGGVYHAKTNISDMKTGSDNASVSFAVKGGVMGTTVIPLTGQVIVRNFQWPETWGLGLSWLASDRWQLGADYKRINWAGVLTNFTMSFVASGAASNGNFANTRLDMTYYQNWKNQNVLQLGAAYKYSDVLTLRFGTNIADNPVSDGYVSPLFPAVMKTHYTGGFGYKLSKTDTVDASLVYAPKVTVTNNWSAVGGSNQTITLGAMDVQIMYAHRF